MYFNFVKQINMKKVLFLILLALVQNIALFSDFEQDQAALFFLKKDYAKSLFYYEQAINNNPNSQALYLEYISCLRLAGMPNEAIKQSYIALEINENNPDLWLNLANVYLDTHQWELAYSSVTKASQLKANIPALIQTLHNIGYRMIVSGEYNIAIKSYDMILEKHANNALALINKGLLFYLQGEESSGKELIEKGIKQSELDSSTQISEWGYRILNSFKTDLKALLNAIQFDHYQNLAENLKSIPPKGYSKSIVIPKIITHYYNIFNQSELKLNMPSDLVSTLVLNNESGSVDLRFTPIFGKDKFDIWISQYPGAISSEDFKNKSESILNNLIKQSSETDKKINTYTDDNVTFNFVSVSKNNYNPIKETDFPITTQGMAKYKNGFILFTIMTLDENAVEPKLDIIKTLIINKK
jgi:hypothetical protein